MSEEAKEEVVDKPFETEEEYEAAKAQLLKGEDSSKEEEEGKTPDSSEVEAKTEDDEGPAIKESKRLRQLNRELKEELDQLRGKVDELSKKPEEKPDRLKTATLDELLEAEDALDEKIYEAKQSGDEDLLRKLRDAKRKVKSEMLARPAKDISSKSKQEKAVTQFQSIVSLVKESYPELGDKSSKLYKQSEQYYKENTELMEQLGELGQYFAVLASLAQKPAKGKEEVKEKKNIVKEMENIIENSTSRTPNTASQKNSKAMRISELSDKEFDEVWNKVKMKEMDLAQLGR